MSADIPNPDATVSIAFQGLAVVCFNKSHNKGQGRWEIAIPRFEDHNLTLETLEGVVPIPTTVNLIEIKARDAVPSKHGPMFQVGETFNRLEKEKQDERDFRWVRDFTDSKELPHRNVKPIPNGQRRIKVTMMYVYDAVSYTKILDSPQVTIVRTRQADTAPVRRNILGGFEPNAASVLDSAEDAGTDTRVMGMDIETRAGGAVDIFFDQVLDRTIEKGDSPQEIFMRNLETPSEITDDRRLEAGQFIFGLGDFFRYYQLFEVEGTKSHYWGKVSSNDGSALDCCCNKTRVSLANLDAFLQSDAPA